MEYHIVHRNPNFSVDYEQRVDVSFVNKMVKSFLRGEVETVINGKKYRIGSSVFRIYEDTAKEGMSGTILSSIETYQLTKSHDIEDHFERNFKNVTDSFLKGRTWGELKEDFYNIYINDGQNVVVIPVLNEQEVHEFLNKWAAGESPIWVSGIRIDLNDPTSIKIFDIGVDWLSKDRGDIKFNIKKYANAVHRGSYNIDTLENFGRDITDKWNIKPFGKSKAKPSSFDWGIIHPEIDRVANSRFNSGHYADAVEAAFKELNDLIKKEFTKKQAQEDDGVSLMRQAFKLSGPVFKLNELKSKTDENIQDGYMQIFAGAMAAIRNPKAHANLEIDQLESWEKIVLASHLMKIWDGRKS